MQWIIQQAVFERWAHANIICTPVAWCPRCSNFRRTWIIHSTNHPHVVQICHNRKLAEASLTQPKQFFNTPTSLHHRSCVQRVGDSVEVIDRELNKTNRLIREAMWIRKRSNTNWDKGSYQLSYVWDNLLADVQNRKSALTKISKLPKHCCKKFLAKLKQLINNFVPLWYFFTKLLNCLCNTTILQPVSKSVSQQHQLRTVGLCRRKVYCPSAPINGNWHANILWHWENMLEFSLMLLPMLSPVGGVAQS